MSFDNEIKGALDAHGAAIDAAIKKFEGQIAEGGKADDEIRSEVKALSEKFESTVTELAQKMDTASEAKASAESAGEQFVKSDEFKALQSGQRNSARIELKNTILTSNIAPVGTHIVPGVAGGVFAPLTVRQVIPTVQISGNAIQGVREATFTNNAAETAEGALKPESAITFAPYNMPVSTVAHWLKISNQLLQDAPAVVSYIETRLKDGLAQRVENQLIVGDGVAPNLSGLTDAGNFTAFAAGAGASLVDSINKAKYALWATGRTPDTAIVNPADWGAMEVAKGSDGHYLYGAPGFAANSNPFGVNIVLSNHIPAGFMLMGALRASATIYQRQGAVVEAGFVGDDFTRNLCTLRCEERLALVVEDAGGILYGDFSA